MLVTFCLDLLDGTEGVVVGFLWIVVVALQTVVDGFVHLGGDARLLLARWTHAVASEVLDNAVDGIDGFADDIVFVLLVGATSA